MTVPELNRALLARQGLLARKRVSVARMVRQAGGLQTQEPRDAFISLWSRIDGFDQAKLRRAAERREIVRGSWMRCTIHTVGADDFLEWRRALAPVIERDTANWRERYEGLDVAKVTKAGAEILSDGRPRSARELRAELEPMFPNVHGEGLAHCVRIHLSVVMTPSEARWGYDRPPKLMTAADWLGSPLSEGSASELLLRGIAAIGPASVADLRTWSGLTGVRELLEPLLGGLSVFRDERGRELYDLPRAPRPDAATEAPVRFLGEFDNVFLSHDDRARIIDPDHAKEFKVSTNGRRRYTFLVDGFVAGTWKPEASRKRLRIELEAFTKLKREQRAEAEAEAKALARLLEPEITSSEVSWSS